MSTTRPSSSGQTATACAAPLVLPAPRGLQRGALRLHHNLKGDPRLARSTIADLTSTMSGSDIEHHVGALPLLLPNGEAPQLELTPPEVVGGIENNNCWLFDHASG